MRYQAHSDLSIDGRLLNSLSKGFDFGFKRSGLRWDIAVWYGLRMVNGGG